MIPKDYIAEWRKFAPWIEDAHVEQDLILSKALLELFSDKNISQVLAFRGGTALYKLYLPPARYSEDLDLVQIQPGPAGDVLDGIQAVLNSWLGKPRRSVKRGMATLVYRFQSADSIPLRLKVETNLKENNNLFEILRKPFSVESRWFSGSANINTYHLDELIGTKMRALYQRKKGRDLFDLWKVSTDANINKSRVIEAFQFYMTYSGGSISRAQFESNLHYKFADKIFRSDMSKLLARGIAWDMDIAGKVILEELISLLPGKPWKGESTR